MSYHDPTVLHPDPDIATATVIHNFTEPSTLERRLLTDETREQAHERAINNYGRLMYDRGYNSETPYMVKALCRRACLQEAAYLRIMEYLAHEKHPFRIKKLATTATDLHRDYMQTLGAIHKLESEYDPLLVQSDYRMIDEPLPPKAIEVLGVAGAVAVDIFNECASEYASQSTDLPFNNNNNERY